MASLSTVSRTDHESRSAESYEQRRTFKFKLQIERKF